MADNLIEILIKFGLDKSKATEAATEVRKLETATKDAGETGVKAAVEHGKATEESTKKVAGLNKAMNLLERQLGSFGHIAKFVLSPIALAIAGISIAFEAAKEALRKWNEEMDRTEERARIALGLTKDQLDGIKLKTIAADEAFQKYQKTISEETQRALADIKTQFDAIGELLKAEEALAVARSDDAEKTKAQFAALQASLGLEERAAVIVEKQAQLRETIRKGAEKMGAADKALGATSPAQAKAELDSLPIKIAQVDKVLEGLRAALGQMPERIWKLGPDKQSAIAVPNPQIPETQAEIQKYQGYRNSLANRQGQYTAGVTAAAEAESLGAALRDLTAELRRLGVQQESGRTSGLYQQAANLQSQYNAAGAAVDTAEQAGDWNAVNRAADAMDNIARQMKFLAQKIVQAEGKTAQAISQLKSESRDF